MITSFIVEYWRNRYQRMNKERFLAANAMALLTHTAVGTTLHYQLFIDTTP